MKTSSIVVTEAPKPRTPSSSFLCSNSVNMSGKEATWSLGNTNDSSAPILPAIHAKPMSPTLRAYEHKPMLRLNGYRKSHVLRNERQIMVCPQEFLSLTHNKLFTRKHHCQRIYSEYDTGISNKLCYHCPVVRLLSHGLWSAVLATVLLEEDSGPTSAKPNLENILHKRRISYPRDGRHI